MEGFRVATIEALAEGIMLHYRNKTLSALNASKKWRDSAIDTNIGHFDNEIQVDKLKNIWIIELS